MRARVFIFAIFFALGCSQRGPSDRMDKAAVEAWIAQGLNASDHIECVSRSGIVYGNADDVEIKLKADHVAVVTDSGAPKEYSGHYKVDERGVIVLSLRDCPTPWTPMRAWRKGEAVYLLPANGSAAPNSIWPFKEIVDKR